MATPDMDVIKEVPGYRVILKAVLKSQIQQLIEQLASTTNEESIILTASVADGTLSHLGSDSAKGFLEDHEDVKSQFLGYCLKSHHKRKQEQEQRDREEEIRKAQEAEAASLALQQQQALSIQSMGNMPGSMGYMPPRGPMPRFQATALSPRQQFRPPGGGLRHQPYPVTRPIRAAASPVRSPMKSPAKLDGQTIKLEPDDETSNQSATSQPSSPSLHQNMKSEPGTDDANSESSSSHKEQNQEGLSLGADLSSLVSGDNSEHDPDVSVKLEAISEAEMDLEITGVEPGRPMQPQDWGANDSVGANFDPTGATGSQADMTGQQGYNPTDRYISSHTNVSGGKTFKCLVCSQTMPRKNSMSRHILTHLQTKPYQCNICDHRCNRRDALRKHYKRIHAVTWA
ncbi:zinc finger and SCAN domain-containing protein 10-like isoform X12 [Dreissena polymorpha]|uniref:zinc finger and SCAN domain-containing protein 10-like isoform X12 n=1 Tax=Dreissena polymorpha TaxID=45954 RepID=UPI0022641C59|nr:zinc finger and SCAN domain-containing protein 10-like isoform X12 [Dreissena polymorpha]